ncbi:hypothetical protein Drorol1_Dr00008154 [Drosera rotundifolia]
MLVRTCLMTLVIVLCWQGSIFYAIGFVSFFGTLEALYLSASPFKFLEGAWFVVTLSIILSSSEEFCAASAQRVNYGKPRLVCARNISYEVAQSFSSLFGIPWDPELGRYLGVQICQGRLGK